MELSLVLDEQLAKWDFGDGQYAFVVMDESVLLAVLL